MLSAGLADPQVEASGAASAADGRLPVEPADGTLRRPKIVRDLRAHRIRARPPAGEGAEEEMGANRQKSAIPGLADDLERARQDGPLLEIASAGCQDGCRHLG
jgi:hypothetical protein